MNNTTTGINNNLIRDKIINGPIGKTVWWLAWPSTITMILQTLNGLIDGVFVGRLGASALAGVGLASQIMFILMSIGIAISIGATALVSRFIGAGEPEQAGKAIRQTILISIIASIIFGLIAYATGKNAIALTGGKGEGLRLGVIYLNILIAGIIPYFLMLALTGIYRGLGDTKTPLYIMIVVTIISLAGDYLLIFGIGPFPKLGVAGAGIATVASRIAATILFSICLYRCTLRTSIAGSWMPSWIWFNRILKIAIPAAIQGLLRSSASILFFGILGRTPEGMIGIAALTIGLRTEALGFMPGLAFSIAAESMVGQNLGAGNKERAIKSAGVAMWQGILITGLIGAAFILFSNPIASMFTNDIKVLPLAASYLLINGISEPFLAISMVLTGALQGAGQTKLPLYATILTLWFIRLPLTYIFALVLDWNTVGAWYSMSLSTIFQGIATYIIFKKSKWTDTII